MRLRCPSASVAALAFAAALVPGALGAAAQEGTPGAQPRGVPAPEECQIEPRTVDELVSLLGPAEGGGEAAETVAADAADQNDIPVPLGERADRETAAEIERTARELLACLNGDDFLRVAALFTDAAVGPALGPAPEDPSGLEAAPEPLPEDEWARLITITDVSLLEDGRAAAFLVFNDPRNPPAGAETYLVIFAQEGDRWLIDGLVDFTVLRPAGTPTAEGTPAA